MTTSPDPTPQPPPLSAHDAEAAFREHLLRKSAAARDRYAYQGGGGEGGGVGPDQILAMLDDPDIVRYPTTVAFDTAFLEPHEFAWPKPLGFHPRDGFCLFIHPHFRARREDWPLLIAYHIPSINYGDLARHTHAELFAASLLGLEPDACYRALCHLADSIPFAGSAASSRI